jgi:hypothetical protein
MIEDLPLLRPDAARSARTVAKCHDRMAARRRRIAAHRRPAGPKPIVVERLLVAGLCVVYLIAMAGEVLAIVGAL